LNHFVFHGFASEHPAHGGLIEGFGIELTGNNPAQARTHLRSAKVLGTIPQAGVLSQSGSQGNLHSGLTQGYGIHVVLQQKSRSKGPAKVDISLASENQF
jgi:hypothetical protein